jgi:hypothetical protein
MQAYLRRPQPAMRALSSLAVEFRYEDVLDERLDRTTACQTVVQVRAWVDGLLDGDKDAQSRGA